MGMAQVQQAESEAQARALERLLDLLEAINNALSDEELLRTLGKLVMTPELFLVVDRLPQLVALLERLTRPKTLESLEALAELLEQVDLKAVAKAIQQPPPEASIGSLVRLLGDRRVVGALTALLSSLPSLQSPESSK